MLRYFFKVIRKEATTKSQAEASEVRLECEEQVTEDSDNSDNENLNRNSVAWGNADRSGSNMKSPPYSPVKMVGRSGFLEPHQREHFQKPTNLSKNMKLSFNEDPFSHGKDASPERPSTSVRWESEKVGSFLPVEVILKCAINSLASNSRDNKKGFIIFAKGSIDLRAVYRWRFNVQ